MIRPQTEAGKAMKKLVSALADYRDPLGPGVGIQRRGAVHDMFVESGSVSFEVYDGRERGFEVTIHVNPANENVHNAVRDGNVHEAVPKVGDVQIHHVCPEWASPCKHEIAALLELTKAIDDDHNVLLNWRGINRSQLDAPRDPVETSKEQWNSIRRVDGERKKTIESLRNQFPQQFVQLEESASVKSQHNSQELSEFFTGNNSDEDVLKYERISKIIDGPLAALPKRSEINSRLILEEALETITEYWLSR
ncbi:MAG: hypothetical protein CL463_00330 [Acidimicrobiaceae bacterium]|nr:hypothetical protein [Acidimicrobiaceae bacterium]